MTTSSQPMKDIGRLLRSGVHEARTKTRRAEAPSATRLSSFWAARLPFFGGFKGNQRKHQPHPTNNSHFKSEMSLKSQPANRVPFRRLFFRSWYPILGGFKGQPKGTPSIFGGSPKKADAPKRELDTHTDTPKEGTGFPHAPPPGSGGGGGGSEQLRS